MKKNRKSKGTCLKKQKIKLQKGDKRGGARESDNPFSRLGKNFCLPPPRRW